MKIHYFNSNPKTLGFNNVKSVRQGKFIEIDIDENDPKQAESQAKQMSNKLLANTVIENFHVDILENQ